MNAKAQVRRYWWVTVFVVFAISQLAWSQNIVTCSSDDMGYHSCSVGPNHGVRLVRQRSDAQCVEGQTFGVRGESIWVNRGCRADFEVLAGGRGYGDRGGETAGTITCSSDDMHRHYCGIPNYSRVRLSRQRSGSPCVEGQTWGVSGNQVWVDRGCRADFDVLAGGRHADHDHDDDRDRDRDRDHDGDRDRDRDRDHDHDADRDHDHYGDNGGGVRTVTCSSDDMHRHTCDVGPNNGIRLIKQRSDARCDYNRTYGFSGNQIWVDRGCRADFEVTSGRGYR